MVRTLIELGIPDGRHLGNLHSLITMGEGEGWNNTAVMSPYPELVPRPAAYVLQLFTPWTRSGQGRQIASMHVEAQTDDVPLLTGSVPALEVLASADESGHHLTLLAINKEMTAGVPAATITATVVISGFTPWPTATVRTLNGPDIAAFNDVGHPTDVAITETTISGAGQSFIYAFPAHSVTLIEMERCRWVYLPCVLRQ